MTAKEKVIRKFPNAYAHDTGRQIVIVSAVGGKQLASCHIRRESWAWALAAKFIDDNFRREEVPNDRD